MSSIVPSNVRRFSFSLAVLMVAVMCFSVFTPSAGAAAASLPNGIPADVTAVKVHRVIDGDQIYIALDDGTLQHVLLAGIDAPNEGDCFYDEAKTKLTDLLPVGTTVYLEASGSVDRDHRLPVRYVWLPGVNGGKALLINTKLVREGDAGFDGTLDTPKYYDNLEKAQETAQSKEAGVWGSCGELHLSTLTPIDASFVIEATAAANNLLANAVSPDDDYIGWLSTQANTVTGSVGQLGLLLGSFSESNLSDPEWISGVTALADLWTTAYNTALAVTPPAEYQDVHAQWIEAMQHYANAADYLTNGLAAGDVTSISSAANELTLGSLLITAITNSVSLSFGS